MRGSPSSSDQRNPKGPVQTGPFYFIVKEWLNRLTVFRDFLNMS
ncbi:hypothetical protein J2S34_000190 [Nitrobacter winogradskyi]|uniref:Uncharacterized protein n=1 Tax=Nitrobacter winogradskyi TaxID=913 RepID=A0ACC6ADF6_NITWI|nr:hypothetical protein [Nitrobacter winogradskyi]